MVKEASCKGKRGYSPEQWQGIIDHWRASGLSKQTYCRQQGIARSVFGRWFKRVVSPRLQKEADFLKRVEESFIPVSLDAARTPFQLKPQLEVILAKGHRLSIQGPFDWEGMSLFLKALLVD